MLRLIMFAITTGLAKKLYTSYTRKQAPFPAAASAPRRRGRFG